MGHVALGHHPRADHIQGIVDTQHDARIAIACAARHQRVVALRDHRRQQQRISIASVGVTAGERAAVGGIGLVILHHHVVRHQVNGVALHQKRPRIVVVLFRLAGADLRGFEQRRRFPQRALVIGGQKRVAQPRPQRVAEEVEVANPFRIGQRLTAGGLYGVAVNGGHRRQILLHDGLRQAAERRQQRNARLLIGPGLEVIAAGLQPGGIGLVFVLFRVRQPIACQRGGIPLQSVAQLRQRLLLKIVIRLAGGSRRHAIGEGRRPVQRDVFSQNRLRQQQRHGQQRELIFHYFSFYSNNYLACIRR